MRVNTPILDAYNSFLTNSVGNKVTPTECIDGNIRYTSPNFQYMVISIANNLLRVNLSHLKELYINKFSFSCCNNNRVTQQNTKTS